MSIAEIKFRTAPKEADVIYRLDHVTKIYEGTPQVVALDDVSIEINRGEIYGIIGMSGAGKSTLVRTLNRLEEVSSGSVSFEGKDLSGLKNSELRKVRQNVGMIFQGFNLLMQKTVDNNIRAALKIAGIPKAEHEQITDRMLEIVGLKDKKKRLSVAALWWSEAASGNRKGTCNRPKGYSV
jgi:D-methionine transport system ATP-binding protein